MLLYPNQFFGLPGCAPEVAGCVILPVPLEKTVSYGKGTWRGPQAILDASTQIELLDEETLIRFEDLDDIYTAPPVSLDPDASMGEIQKDIYAAAQRFRGRFLLGLGGEHSVSYGLITGLTDRLQDLTVVHIDAHADLIDELGGSFWSHGTVMRRLWDHGVRLIQIGIRSISPKEYDFIQTKERIETFFGHQLCRRLDELLGLLDGLTGDVYLSIDVDGLDPSIIPSTGTPMPGGLSWYETMDVLGATFRAPKVRVIGADVVEFVASPHPPGCDIVVAKLISRLIALWARRRSDNRRGGEY
ncbi:agmatinase [Desulfovibrionales bacterium]